MLQLADEGLLEILPPEEALDPTKVDLDRDVAAATVKAIMSHVIVAKPDRQWVRIERLFTCLGANHKPWGPLLVAAKQGKLKGKLLSREDHFSMSGLYIHRELADEFRLAILNETQPTFVAAGNRSVDWCPEMLRGEAECYLNVSCSEITWLARQGYFGDDAREGGPLRRSDVESLGQEFIRASPCRCMRYVGLTADALLTLAAPESWLPSSIEPTLSAHNARALDE